MTGQGGNGSRGFTLIEVIVVIAVVSIMASIAVPYAVKFIDQARMEGTRKQIEEIHRAIVGDPKSPTAGYVGDMGALPASLDRLNTQGSQAPRTYGTLGVKYGWDGPYVRYGYSAGAYLVDGWGRNLVYTASTGQIRSQGPNTTTTADDIVYPPSSVVPSGRLLVNLHVWRTDNTTSQYVLNPQPGAFVGMQASVQAYYSLNGARSPVPLSAGVPPGAAGPPYSLGPTHAGFHEVFATCTLPPNAQVGGRAVVYVPENNQQTQLNLYLR
jgi:prepilin-type N-terminal cleavage/methylation domain-containing protein